MPRASSVVRGTDDALEREVIAEIQFKFLRSVDTPTGCNLIEMAAPERRGARLYRESFALSFSGIAADGRFRQDGDDPRSRSSERPKLHAEADGLSRLRGGGAAPERRRSATCCPLLMMCAGA